MKEIGQMTIAEFKKVPYRKSWQEDIGEFDSLIIMPDKVNQIQLLWYKIRVQIAHILKLNPPYIYEVDGLHGSGYRTMDFVAIKDRKPICRLSGCSDILHIEGIGGYGFDWLERYGTVPKLVAPRDWSIDCLPVSGLLRIFNCKKIVAGPALSSFEIYTQPATPTK